MSDLFKKHRPKLTEREERALWERVRTMPREAGGRTAPGASRRPWWAGVWAVPAVRFGAPALAVALVAVVWVVQQRPEAPLREMARAKAEAPGATATAPAPEAGPEDLVFLAEPDAPPVVGRGARDETLRDAAPEVQRKAGSDGRENVAAPSPHAASARPGTADDLAATESEAPAREALPPAERRSDDAARDRVPAGGAPLAAFAPPPAPAARNGLDAGRTAEQAAPSSSTARRSAPLREGMAYRETRDRVADLRAARGDAGRTARIGARLLGDLAGGRSLFVDSMVLSRSRRPGMLAVVGSAGSFILAGDAPRILVGRDAGRTQDGRWRVEAEESGPGRWVAAVIAARGSRLDVERVDGKGTDRDGFASDALPGGATGQRAGELALELLLALADDDRASFNRVDTAARAFLAEDPANEAARAFAAWCDDARAAFAAR